MKMFRKIILIITLIAYCASPLLALNIRGRWSRGSRVLDIDYDSIAVKEDGKTVSKYRYSEKNGRVTIKKISGSRDVLGEGTCYVSRDDDELVFDGYTYYKEGMSTSGKVGLGALLLGGAVAGGLYIHDKYTESQENAQEQIEGDEQNLLDAPEEY